MRLRIITLNGAAKEIVIAGSAARLGKDLACEVHFDATAYPMVSGEHARIDCAGGKVRLTHLSRSNKTLLNDQPVENFAEVKNGDRIRLGYTGPVVEVVSVEAQADLQVGAAKRAAPLQSGLPDLSDINQEPRETKNPSFISRAMRGNRLLGAGAIAAFLIVAMVLFLVFRVGTKSDVSRPSIVIDQDTPLELLVAALKDGPTDERSKALAEIGKRGPSARLALSAALDVLKDSDPELSGQVRGVVGRLGPVKKSDLPIYKAALRDPSPEARSFAASQVSSLGREAEDELVILRIMCLDGDEAVSSSARAAVARIEADLLTVYTKNLQDPAENARHKAARDIAALGVGAKSALPSLVTALGDANPAVRVEVINAFAAIGPDAILVLGEALRDKDAQVRLSAIVGLGRMGPDARFVLPQLVAVLYDTDAKAKEEVLITLNKIGPYAATELVQMLEREKDADRKKPLVEVLARLGPEAGPLVRKALDSASPEAVKAAASVISNLNTQPSPTPVSERTGLAGQIQGELLSWFKGADSNNDGYLDKDELAREVRGKNAKPFDFSSPDKPAKKLTTSDFSKYPDFAFLSRLDRDGDGKISRDEYERWAYDYAEVAKNELDTMSNIRKAQQRLMETGLSQAMRVQTEATLAQLWNNYYNIRRAQSDLSNLEWLQGWMLRNTVILQAYPIFVTPIVPPIVRGPNISNVPRVFPKPPGPATPVAEPTPTKKK